MANLLRKSWSVSRGGANPATWELPVNQASKWLVPKSGSFRILGEGGSVALTNNDQRRFLLSVFVGDGGSVNIGGTSGAETIQISRTGSTITVTARPNTGGAVTKTATTNMPPERWTNVYLKARESGILSNQITIDFQVDFQAGVELLATGALFGAYLRTGGKTLTCNSLSGWAWFGSTTGGFWGIGGTSSVPIEDSKYREAVLNNATWDIDANTSAHTYTRPSGLQRAWAWLIQGGGGDGASGYSGATGNCSDGSPGSPGGDGGNDGAPGSPGSSGGDGGQSYERVETCEDVWDPNGGTCDIDNNCTGGWVRECTTDWEWVCHDGAGGDGGSGGSGGRGVWLLADVFQEQMPCAAGSAGAPGSGNGGDGGDGGHTTFGGISTESALPYVTGRSQPTIRFGSTTFTHQLGGANQQGGVVFYYQW